MKITYLILGILLLCGIFFYLTSCKNKSSSKEKRSISEEDTLKPKAAPKEANAFKDLRSMAFSITPKQLQLSLPADKTIVYGVIMDWGIDTSIATIVSYQTGDASLYLSSGGGVVGGGLHENINNAAKKFVALAQRFISKSEKNENNSLPQKDEVKFYLLTNNGIYQRQEKMINFENGKSPWLELFENANNVLTELRTVSEK